ncbi:MAG TPA: tRNA pseudouridine(13) synthase TruD [Xanthomonadaceae bacterium]|nr:tRNA pseudouridine(13) synthase TruD [Xanthomonadaceae bacterium]
MIPAAELPAAFGAPVLSARLRVAPEDFRVDEVLGFEASGEGEHLLVQVEKRGANTARVARELARWAGIGLRDVGFAGMKDRHAVCTQAFTLRLPGRRIPEPMPESDEFRLLSWQWHRRKLPRGALQGNRFVLRLREVQGERDAIDTRLHAIAARGIPNYFGLQRFGHGGGNLELARQLFAGARLPRERRALALSAARSMLFNTVLAARVDEGSWALGIDGEVWMLEGSRSVFGPEPDDPALRARCRELDIHPSGPLWGRGELRTQAAARALELAALAPYGEFRSGLERAGLAQERRALRVRAGGLHWRWIDASTLELAFELSAGAYATALLHALGPCADASGPGDGAQSAAQRPVD